MGPKKNSKSPEDILEVVVVIEEGLGSTSLGETIIETLSKESFAENGRVKCLTQESNIPHSIQWMTKISGSEWELSENILVLHPVSKFVNLVSPHTEVDQLLLEMLGKLPDPKTEKIYINLIKDKVKPSNNRTGDQNKILNAELKKKDQDRAQELSVESLMLYNTTLHLAAINSNEACTKVIKSTKSVLLSLKPSVDSAWYPKASKPFVRVSKNKVGLNKLWQKYLMQNVNVEQAKVISNESEFSSLNRAVTSYSNCLNDEKKAVELLSKKALRPNGATKDSLTLGNKRPCVGVKTSRKIFKVLTTLDPDLEI